MSKKTKTELKYTVEALQDEIERLEEINRADHQKLWEVIQENDRLTLTYEPYRPPGDEHENLDFYELIDENKDLKKQIRKLVQKNYQVQTELIDARTEATKMSIAKNAKEPWKPLIKNDRWWNFSVELWPGAWGINYYRYQWQKHGSKSREGSINIGPIGFSWNREPKNHSH